MNKKLLAFSILFVYATSNARTYETYLSCSGMDSQGQSSVRVDPNTDFQVIGKLNGAIVQISEEQNIITLTVTAGNEIFGAKGIESVSIYRKNNEGAFSINCARTTVSKGY